MHLIKRAPHSKVLHALKLGDVAWNFALAPLADFSGTIPSWLLFDTKILVLRPPFIQLPSKTLEEIPEQHSFPPNLAALLGMTCGKRIKVKADGSDSEIRRSSPRSTPE